MSADIWLLTSEGAEIPYLDDNPTPTRVSGGIDGGTFNLTYNLTPMLRAAGMPPWRDFIDMKASEAGPIWQKVADELAAAPERYEPMNPPNGWGSYEGALFVIGALAEHCAKHPDATVGGWL